MISKKGLSDLRWLDYFLRQGAEAREFWEEYLKGVGKKTLFILGLGFDPRMNLGVRMLVDAGAQLDCILIKFDEGANSPSREHEDLVKTNYEGLCSIVPQSKIKDISIPIWAEGMRVGPYNSASAFNASDIQEYTDIIVDVSAMPIGIFYPMVGKLLSLVDNFRQEGRNINLHLIAAENAKIDEGIMVDGLDEDANYLYGFTGIIETESASESPKIWIPILGKNQKEQLQKIWNLINPEEVCPVLPMPAANPRKVDDLLLEYREFLFDNLRLESSNFIYASERNPFSLYREICRTIIHYNMSLEPISGCKVTISPLSSKLLSIGAMIAAYELKNIGSGVGVALVDGQGYRIDNALKTDQETKRTEIFTMWLAGECYEKNGSISP
jgi:hypothetical protein